MDRHTRAARRAAVTLLFALAWVQTAPAAASDDLLETLAQKGVISADEYARLKEQPPKPAAAAPVFSTDDGLKLMSADGAFSLQIGTMQQIDVYAYDDDGADLADGTELRRSRLSLSGNLFKDWQYRVEYEFSKTPTATGNGSSQITDAYVAYTALKPFVLTIGQFKPAFSMEALAQDKSATFMERGLPFYLISPLTVRTPGVQIADAGHFWSLAAGVSGAPLSESSSGDEGWGGAARGTLVPYRASNRLIHLGAGYTWRRPTQNNTGTPAVQGVSFSAKPESDQASAMVSAALPYTDHYQFIGTELAAQWGAASLQSEYDWVEIDRDHGNADASFASWYAQLAYTLTGEPRPYKVDKGVFDGIKPLHPFGKDGWGAWEVAARISQIDLNDGAIVGGKLQDLTLGVSWYLNSYLRVSANYVDVLKLDRPGNALDGQKPSAFQMRFQLAI